MKITKIIITALILLGCALSGCMDTTVPQSDYVLQENAQGSASAIKSIYNGISSQLVLYQNDDAGIEVISYGGLQAMLESATTDMVCTGYNGFNTLGAFCTGSLSARGSNRGIYPFYVYYGYIKTVNDLIRSVGSTYESNDEMKKYKGIAHAYRALYYMDLVTIYEFKENGYISAPHLLGLGVPVVTEDLTESQAKNNPRATVGKVYELIFDDLRIAEEMLADMGRTLKTDPDITVVYGLQARANLNRAVALQKTDVAQSKEHYAKAANYARKAIDSGQYRILSQDEWEHPTDGFNNLKSQNSWMLAASISSSNTAAVGGSFNFTMLMSTEQSWLVYGWRVGRSLSRRTYNEIPDGDFRKHSWLDHTFFEEKGDSYSGYQYKVASSYAHIRRQITYANGFNAIPYLYVNIKFKPRDGNYVTGNIGGTTDYPMMRIEEMYFIEAEAKAQTDLAGARSLLNGFMKSRILDGTYDCTPKAGNLQEFIQELMFQKRIEFWGEGRNYYDAKRLALGLHRGYTGVNASNYNHTFDIDGIAPQWTLPFPLPELSGNPALIDYDNPNPYATDRFWAKDNAQLIREYGNENFLNN